MGTSMPSILQPEAPGDTCCVPTAIHWKLTDCGVYISETVPQPAQPTPCYSRLDRTTSRTDCSEPFKLNNLSHQCSQASHDWLAFFYCQSRVGLKKRFFGLGFV